MTSAEKEFVISYIFKDVSSMKGDEENCFTRTEEHFGVPWKIQVHQTKDRCKLAFWCSHEQTKKWSIETLQENKIMSKSGEELARVSEARFEFAPRRSLQLTDSETQHVVDVRSSVEIRVKILSMIGIESETLRSFDESTKEFSDVVLVVDDKKFHVSKLFLASQSPFFKSTLLNLSKSEGLPEHTLKDVKAADFQKFLELLYGENPIDDSTVARIACVADLYDAKIAMQKCEKFLIENSKKSLKEKLQLAHRFKLEKLKNHCLSKISSTRDIREAVDDNLNEMDPSLVGSLLKKSLDLHELYTPVVIACFCCTCSLLPLLFWKGLKHD